GRGFLEGEKHVEGRCSRSRACEQGGEAQVETQAGAAPAFAVLGVRLGWQTRGRGGEASSRRRRVPRAAAGLQELAGARDAEARPRLERPAASRRERGRAQGAAR